MTSIRDMNIDSANPTREVEFRFYRKEAAQVWVVGDFTGWQGGRLAMERQADGWWALNKPLPPGEYRFRYLADEQQREAWFTDFAAHGVEFAKGNWNSVMVVPHPMPVIANSAPESMEQDTQQRLAA